MIHGDLMIQGTREKPKQPERAILPSSTSPTVFAKDIFRGNSEADIALLRAVVELDVEKALSKAKKALELGANVNAKDGKFSVTALMLASSKGRIELVDLLVKKGADVNVKDDEGFTALWYASRANHIEVMAYLQEHGAKG